MPFGLKTMAATFMKPIRALDEVLNTLDYIDNVVAGRRQNEA